MTSIGELSVGLGLDSSELDRQIKNLGNRYPDVRIPAKLDSVGLDAEWKRQRDKFNHQTVRLAVSLDRQNLEKEFNQYRERLSGQKIDVAVNLVVNPAQLTSIKSQLEQLTVKTQVQQSQGSSFLKEFEKGITSSISKGFSQARQGNLFGGIGSLLMAPLQGAMQGAFMGIGLPLGQQVGQGLSKGLQTALGESIGSIELLSERIVDRSIEGIGALRQQARKIAEDNSYVRIITQRLDTIKSILDRFGVDLRPETFVGKVVSREEAKSQAAAIRFDERKTALGSRKKAAAGLQQETLVALEGFQDIRKLNQEIAKRRKLQQLAVQTITEISPLAEAGRATQEQVQDLNQATAALERVQGEIDSFTQTKDKFLAQLRDKISQLSKLGIEKDLTGLVDKLFSLPEVLQADLQAKEQAIATITARNQSVKFKTPESIKEAKGDKLRERASSTEAALKKEQLRPDGSIELVQKLDKQAKAARRALELFELEIADPRKIEAEAEKTKARLDAVSEELGQALSTLGKRLEANLPKTLSKVEPKSQVSIAGIQSAQPAQPIKAPEVRDMTSVVGRAIQEIAKAEKFQAPNIKSIPSVSLLPEKADQAGLYIPESNTVKLKKSTIEEFRKGIFSDKAVRSLTHELIHGFQFDFGKTSLQEIAASQKAAIEVPDLTAAQLDTKARPDDKRTIAEFAEGSVASFSKSVKGQASLEELNAVRKLEGQAYVKEAELFPIVKKALEDTFAVNKFKDILGIGGSKAAESLARNLREARNKVQGLQEPMAQAGKEGEYNQQIARLKAGGEFFQEVGNFFNKVKAVGIEGVDPETARALINNYEGILKGINAAVLEVEQALPNLKTSIPAKAQQEVIKAQRTPVKKKALSTEEKLAELERREEEKAKVLAERQFQKEYEASIIKSPTVSAISQMVADFSGVELGKKLPTLIEAKKYKLDTLDMLGAAAAHDASTDEIILRPEAAKALKQPMGTGVEIPDEVVRTIIHEIRHSAQTKFGKISQEEIAQGKFAFPLLKPETPEEIKRLTPGVEHSTEGYTGNLPKEIIRQLEEDAYTFEFRYYKQVQEALKKGLPLKEVIKSVNQASAKVSQSAKTPQLAASIKEVEKESLTLYETIAETVASFSSLFDIKEIPAVVLPQGELKAAFEKADSLAAFLTDLNKVALKPEIVQTMQSGGKLEYEAVGSTVHELRHAAQLGFGKLSQKDLAKGQFAVDLLVPTPEELKIIKGAIDKSVASAKVSMPKVPESIIRAVEEDAYTFELRYGKIIYDMVQDSSDAIEDGLSSIETPDLSDELARQFAELEKEIAGQSSELTTDLTDQMKALEAELATSVPKIAQETAQAVTEGKQELNQEIAQIAGVKQDLVAQLANPGLTVKDLQRIAKLSGVSGYRGKGVKTRADLEKLINQSAIQGTVDPQSLGSVIKQVEAERAKARMYADTAIPKPSPEAKGIASELAVTPVEEIQEFAKQTQAELNEAIAKAKTIPDLSEQIRELDRLHSDIIEAQSIALEAMTLHTDEAARKHLEMLKVRLQSSRKEIGMAATAAQAKLTGSLAEKVRVKQSPSSMEQAIQQKPGALYATATFGGGQADEKARAIQKAKEDTERLNKLFLEVQAKNARRQREAAQDAIDDQERNYRQQATLFDRMGQRYGIFNFMAPELRQEPEAQAKPAGQPQPKPRRNGKPQLNLFNRIIAPTVEKQSAILAVNAESLLADVETQLIEARQAEKQAKIISKQIKSNEARIDKITSAILTEGQVRKLGQKDLSDEQLKELNAKLLQLEQIVAEDKAKLAQGKQVSKNRKGLENLAGSTRKQLQEVGKILGKDALTDKDIQRLGQLRTGLTNIFDQMQQPIPGNNFLAQFGFSLPKITGHVWGLVKGFLAFNALNNFQNFFQNLSVGAFKAYVDLDALRTTLNYTYGGAIQGGAALKFVREEVDRLRIPLEASTEGFAQLSAATKGTASEGQTTRGLFTGIAEATTVLSLSGEKTAGVMQALAQTSSKGKLYMEELLQVSERVPGTFGLVAQSLGVSEEQLSKMLQTGRVLAQDFLPRFGAQLQSQFGDAAKDASNNAQSAIYAFQNSILSLQQKLGAGVAPVAVKGLNALTGIFKFAADNGETLSKVLSATSLVLTVQLIPPVFNLIKSLPFVQAGIAKITGGLAGMTAAAKTFALQFAVVYGALELFNLSTRLLKGGELAQSFKEFENTARSAADGVRDLKKEVATLNQQEPPASNWSDSVLMFLRNLPLLNKVPKEFNIGGFSINPGTTFAERDRDRAIESIYNAGGAIKIAAIDAREQALKASRGQGDAPVIQGIDAELQQISQRRSILQAEIDRTYTRLGKIVPPEAKQQLADLNKEFQQLSEKRADVAKPLIDQLNRVKKAGEAAKAQLDFLDTPDGQAQFAGSNIKELRDELELQVKTAKTAENQLQKLLLTAKADPILSLSDAFRKLNVELAKNAEEAQYSAAARQESIAKQELAGFSKDPFASQRAALDNAKAERQKLLDEMGNLQQSINERRTIFSDPTAQPIMQELGVTAETSAAEIQNIIDRLPDGEDAKKSILENLKQIHEEELKQSQNRAQLAQQDLQVRQQIEAQTTAEIEKNVADRDAIIKRGEAEAIAAIRQRQLAQGKDRITEKQAAELIAKEQLKTVQAQENAANAQLTAYRNAYKSGQISAKQYMDKERELVSQLSEFKKQKAEQEIAVREAVNQRILDDLEFANRKAEAAITASSNQRILEIKKAQLGGLSELDAGKQIEQSQTDTLTEQIEQTKQKLSQIAALKQQGVKSDRDATLEQIQLQEQLGQQQIQLADQEIAAVKRVREERTRSIDSQIQAQERLSEKAQAELDLQLKGVEYQEKELDLLQRADDLTKQLLDSRQNLAKALSDASIGQSQVKLDQFGRGQDLFGRILSEDNLTTKVSAREIDYLRQTIGAQLGEVGIGVNFSELGRLKEQAGQGSVEAQRRLNQMELSVLQARNALEDEMAAKRLAALGVEQEYARESLEMDLKRNEIQARSAVFAAQQAEFQTRQSELQLKNQIKIAELEEQKAALIEDQRERDIALEQARGKREIAENSLAQLPGQFEQANRMKSLAQQQLDAQTELANNARAAQESTQAQERSQFAAAEAARKQASALQGAETYAKGIAEASDKAANAAKEAAAASNGLSFTNLTGEQRQQLTEARQAFDNSAGSRNRQADLLQSAMSMKNNPFFELLLRQSGNQDIAGLAEKLKDRPMEVNSIIARAQVGNKDVIAELQKLNEKVEKLGRPNVSVSTATPLEDTLKIMSNMR